MLSNVSVPLVGAVDTAVVGHLPEPHSIGAVALGALIFSFLFWAFSFLRMGTGGFAAQAYGAGNTQELSDTLQRALLLAVVLGVLSAAIGWPFVRLFLYVVDSSTVVEDLTRDYAAIRLFSAPAVLCVYAISGYLVGVHNMRALFVLQLVLNVINMLLDLLFVVGFGWGVQGVAFASVLAEYAAMLFGLYLLRDALKEALQRYDRQRLLERTALLRFFHSNINIFIRTLCLQLGFGYFTVLSARQGEIVLAANAILMHFQHIMAYALDGFATAVEATAGAAFGAVDRREFRRAVRLTSFWSVVIAIFAGLIYLWFGTPIINLFTSIESVADTAREYLPWMIIAPIVSVWSFQLDGIFIGTSHTREMRNAMLVSLGAYLVLLQWLIPAYGNHGLFLGFMLLMLLRAATLMFYYPAIVTSINPVRGKVRDA